MTPMTRRLTFSTALACLALTLSATPSFAVTHHHTKKHHHTSSKTASIKAAQEHLSHLGYYKGKIDGIMGPQTRTAIKHFQKDKGLKVDGILGPKTSHALEVADSHMPPVIGRHAFMTHDIVTSADQNIPIDPDFAPSLKGETKTVASRFGSVDISETGAGGDKRYNVNLNGQPILTVEGQPSVIGISPTYDLGNEEAIVFTTYSPTDANCMYKNHVLALNNTGTQLLDVQNCTWSYQARVDNGSLDISFPEHDDNRAVGATWRLEGLRVERL